MIIYRILTRSLASMYFLLISVDVELWSALIQRIMAQGTDHPTGYPNQAAKLGTT